VRKGNGSGRRQLSSDQILTGATHRKAPIGRPVLAEFGPDA
jgi:hypothetical protein